MSAVAAIADFKCPVIARAYDNEPVRVGALSYFKTGKLYGCTIYRLSIGYTIGFPQRCLFEDDADLFFELKQAYESGDATRLESLWSEAVPFTPEGRLPLEQLRR